MYRYGFGETSSSFGSGDHGAVILAMPAQPAVSWPGAHAPRLDVATPSLVAAAGGHGGILFACLTNGKGLAATLNWAAHVAQTGIRPVVGFDGLAPLAVDSVTAPAWRSADPLFILLPTFEEALDAAVHSGGSSLLSARRVQRSRSGERVRSRVGFQFWLMRWHSVRRLLAIGLNVLLSDNDVVWHRDPRPYLRALGSLHPALDVLIHSDHSVYAEDLREDLPYASAATPNRATVISRWRRVLPANATAGVPPDFDLDPMPAQGLSIGTWNPGLLYVRATAGGDAMVGAWMADFADKGVRRVKRHEKLSSQSEMNSFLACAFGRDGSGRQPVPRRLRSDPLLYDVPLRWTQGNVEGAPPLAVPAGATRLPRATLGLLPALQFGSFAATHVVREADVYGVAPFATHATQVTGYGVIFAKNNVNHMGPCASAAWCLGSPRVTAATVKAFTMRHFGLWSVPDDAEYYAGRYLSYTPRPSLAARVFATAGSGDAQWTRHLALLQEQLQEFQTALALATTLNRTLVLPRVLCSCVFAMWPFVSDGNTNCQPLHMQGLLPRVYECLPSYWLHVPSLMRSTLPLREASFLSHPAARAVQRSRVSLHRCDLGEGQSAVASTAVAAFCTVRGQPVLRAEASSGEAAAALGPLSSVRLIHFEDVRRAFGGFDSAAAAAEFGRRASALLGGWCCHMDGRAGAVSGTHFPLAFSPPVGVVARSTTDSRGGGRWERMAAMNNVFGRASLKADTACCKYLGTAPTLSACTALAEAYAPARVSSVTLHLPATPGPWASTCYGIVDGTWLPSPVRPGQAAADSARRPADSALSKGAPQVPGGWANEALPVAV